VFYPDQQGLTPFSNTTVPFHAKRYFLIKEKLKFIMKGKTLFSLWVLKDLYF
jgi:hypothetical protein